MMQIRGIIFQGNFNLWLKKLSCAKSFISRILFEKRNDVINDISKYQTDSNGTSSLEIRYFYKYISAVRGY